MRWINIQFDGKVNNNEPFFATGTSLQDEIDISYQRLVEVFGEPNAENDGYKVDAEWEIFTPDGVATIYNYKTGKNYLGKEGLKVEDIREWHIGGNNQKVAGWVRKALGMLEE